MTDLTEERLGPERATQTLELVQQIAPLLRGKPREVQSAALADLLARWLAGHLDTESTEATHRLRSELLAQHMALVVSLIQPNEQMILETIARKAH